MKIRNLAAPALLSVALGACGSYGARAAQHAPATSPTTTSPTTTTATSPTTTSPTTSTLVARPAARARPATVTPPPRRNPPVVNDHDADNAGGLNDRDGGK